MSVINDQNSDDTSHVPSAASAAVAGARNSTENNNASASQTPPYAIVATRKPSIRTISSVLGGNPSSNRPSPITSSHSAVRPIVSASRPARNLPSSSASR